MSSSPTPVGAILAGGRSRRFGSEKALAEIEGRPMIARVAEVLARGCRLVAVNAPPESAAAAWARTAGLPVLPDPADAPDGPLAGLVAALGWAVEEGADLLATAPCDTPWLPEDVTQRLLDGLSPGAGVAFAANADGLQPLCAIWRTSRRRDLLGLMAGGRHPPVRAAAAALNGVAVDFPDPEAFANVNRPEDLRRRTQTP